MARPVEVNALITFAVADPSTTMTSKFRRTNSAASSPRRSKAPFGVTLLDDDVLSLDITIRAQTLAESIELLLVWTGVSEEANAGDLGRLLRARRQWPRRRRTADQRNEIAPSHLINLTVPWSDQSSGAPL